MEKNKEILKEILADNIHIGRDGQDRLLAGIEKVCTIIGMSYGAAGSNVLLKEELYPGHSISNDGKSIVDKIQLADPIEQMGVNLMKELGDKAEKTSGDGRKTTMILANAILKEARTSDAEPLDIKRSLDECLPIILKNLDEQTKKITPDTVGAVASIAAESSYIGSILQDIYTEIGPQGIVELDNSNTFSTFYEIKEGVRLRHAGFISPYMATDGTQAVYKKPKILITKQKIGTLADIDPLFQKLSKDGTNELVIYCDEIDPSVLQALAFTHAKSIFKTLIIKAPTLWKDWLFEDFSRITGATIFSVETGHTLKDAALSDLGTCEKIISTKDETTVIGIKDVSEHIKALKAENTDESKLRASWLETKAAILKLGANSESELSYLSKKARDGRNAAYWALQGGVVIGGGFALDFASACLPTDLAESVGGKILRAAMHVPAKQILDNMGLDIEDVDPVEWEEKIVDASLIVKNAIINAVSVAGTVLTTKVIIS